MAPQIHVAVREGRITAMAVELVDRLAAADPARRQQKWRLPSWLLSTTSHLAIILLLTIATMRVSRGLPELRAPILQVGIVLKSQTSDATVFENQQSTYETPPDSQPPLEERSTPVEPDRAREMSASAELSALATANRSLLDARPVLPAVSVPSGTTGRSQIFPEATGKSFVWVIDRSASMAHYRAIDVAKRELLASLSGLASHASFQVIVYNSQPILMGERAMVSATTQNVDRAKKFLDQIEADGGTKHSLALLQAFQLRPEVIFFLTDADAMTVAEVHALTAENRRAFRPATVHCIEFGAGPAVALDKPLRLLAAENDGSYTYIDVTRFAAKR
jgi:hypothetical protein